MKVPLEDGQPVRVAAVQLDHRSGPQRSPAHSPGSSARFRALAAAIRGDTAAALAGAAAIDAASERPQAHLLQIYHQLGDRERSGDLVRRIGALPGGGAILARQIALYDGRSLTFDLADAPNFSARLREAGVDPGSLPVMPRLGGPGGAHR